MNKTFNTAGPCETSRNHMLPAVQRLPSAKRLIAQLGYFVLHAPRQTGKTTTLRHLAREFTEEGQVTALYFSCEAAEVARDDYEAAEKIVVSNIYQCAQIDLPKALQPPARVAADPGHLLGVTLKRWAVAAPSEARA